MNFTKSSHLQAVVYVINFKAPDVKMRFKQAAAEAAFNGLIGGQSQQTNVPDTADPMQARIIFGNEKKSIAISQTSCQLQMNFSDSEHKVDEQLKVVKKNVQDFYKRALQFVDENTFAHSGLVIELAFPSKDPVENLQNYIVDQFYKGEHFGKVASAQFAIGFEKDGLYLTVSSSVYENRRMEISANNNNLPTFIDVSTLPIIDYGLVFKVDVNDRPRQAQNKLGCAPSDLITAAEDFISNRFEKFSGLTL